jgi:glycosyltransferase involved in cell wall biosynthesis
MKVELITVVVPCFNEELIIEEFYRRTKALTTAMKPKQFELIFINDGSTDQTRTILDKIAAADKTVKILHLAQNRGHQIALTAGMDHAAGDAIITIDADLQHPPELIGEMIEKIENNYDIVHAKRRSRSGETLFKKGSARDFYFFGSSPVELEND